MKDKIKQLLDKAEVYYNDDMYSDYNDLASLQKFAELIIKECALWIELQDEAEHPTAWLLSEELKEHFGVEE